MDDDVDAFARIQGRVFFEVEPPSKWGLNSLFPHVSSSAETVRVNSLPQLTYERCMEICLTRKHLFLKLLVARYILIHQTIFGRKSTVVRTDLDKCSKLVRGGGDYCWYILQHCLEGGDCLFIVHPQPNEMLSCTVTNSATFFRTGAPGTGFRFTKLDVGRHLKNNLRN